MSNFIKNSLTCKEDSSIMAVKMSLENRLAGKDLLSNSKGGTLIGEPVTRPDGKILRAWDYGGSFIEMEVDDDQGLRHSGYTSEEIVLLGSGDFMRGITKLAQAHYFASAENFRLGGDRELEEEIKVLKLQRGSR